MKLKYGILFAFFVLGVALPAGLGLWSMLTPDVAIEAADAGRFVSASSRPGGLFAVTTTAVQSTRGSFTLYGNLSAARGQPLRIERRLKGRMWLCVQTKAPVCQPLAGPWAGPLQPVPHADYHLAPLYRVISPAGIGNWLLLGGVATFVALLMVAASARDRQVEGQG